MKTKDLPNEFDNLHLKEELIPNSDVLKYGKTVLQVGARPGDGWVKVFDCFKKHGYNTFHVLEAHEPNVNWLKEQKNFPIGLVVHGDIRKIDKYDELMTKYDVIIFWHGWEHCTYEETRKALPKIMKKCSVHIAGMPWGKWEQGEIKDNPYEKHLTHWMPNDLESLGFDECFTFNAKDKEKGANNHNVMYGVKYAL